MNASRLKSPGWPTKGIRLIGDDPDTHGLPELTVVINGHLVYVGRDCAYCPDCRWADGIVPQWWVDSPAFTDLGLGIGGVVEAVLDHVGWDDPVGPATIAGLAGDPREGIRLLLNQPAAVAS